MKHEERVEAYIGLALDDLLESSPSELKTESQLKDAGMEIHQFSPAFEKKMRKICAQSKRHEWFQRHRRSLRRIAASVAILICVGGVTIASVDAIRIPIVNFFLRIGNLSSEFALSKDENLPVSEKFELYYPTYIPKGYVVVDSKEGEDFFSVTYQKDEMCFFFLSFNRDNTGTFFDTEDSSVEKFEIKNTPVVISTRNNQTIVIWQGNGFTFTISGMLEKTECLKMLNSCNIA